MTLIKEARTTVLYGLGGVVLGLGLFVATTWFGLGFRVGSLHLPTILVQIAELVIAAASLFLVFAKTEVCGKCGATFDEAKTRHSLELKDRVQTLIEQADLAGLSLLEPMTEYHWQAVEITYGGCSRCGKVAYLETTFAAGQTPTRKVVEGESAQAISTFVSENGDDE